MDTKKITLLNVTLLDLKAFYVKFALGTSSQ